ncbi:hypothetical protein D3C80_1829480 [compost metagenome]
MAFVHLNGIVYMNGLELRQPFVHHLLAVDRGFRRAPRLIMLHACYMVKAVFGAGHHPRRHTVRACRISFKELGFAKLRQLVRQPASADADLLVIEYVR